MRSRPDLTLFVQPSRLTPGTSFRAEARLGSRSDTPVDAIEFVLVGTERRFTHNVSTGTTTVPHHEERRLFALRGVVPAMILTKGEHRPYARFDLPAGLPPSYRSEYASIEYALDVRVRIPWWPDRHERYLLPVRLVPATRTVSRSQTFCTSDRGAQGTDLYLEASLDRTEHTLGDEVHGAVSVSNVAHHRIRRIEVSFATLETPRISSSIGTTETGRYAARLLDGAPEDGKPLPFRVSLPKKGPPTFTSAMIAVTWQIELRAVIAFGTDVTLKIPIAVTEPGARLEGAPAPLPRVAPVGKERRALVWADVARRMHLENDAEEEQMTGRVGPVAVAITLEERGDAGLCHVATLRWTRLGIAMTLTERRWIDAFSGMVLEAEGPFGERFAVRSADLAQSRALFDEEAQRALVPFEEVAADDEGAVLASPGSAHSVTELATFVGHALDAAKVIAKGIARIPAPRAMAPFVGPWRSFADRHQGRFEIGRVYVHDATIDRERVDVGARYAKNGELEATLVRLHLPAPLPGEIDAASDVPADVRARIDAIATKSSEIRVGPDVIEARLAAPLEDPEAVVPLIESMTALARALRGERDGGPYR